MNKKPTCSHCPGGVGLQHPLLESELFWIVADVHPITEGHILIFPKEHIPCMGELSAPAFLEFKKLYRQVKKFIEEYYGATAFFEHGKIYQTVFHAHMHFLPFNKVIDEVISDSKLLKKCNSLDDIKNEFTKYGQYIYLEIENKKWFVDTSIGYPGFFRRIFANLLNANERANWKTAQDNKQIMLDYKKDIENLKPKWKQYSPTSK